MPRLFVWVCCLMFTVGAAVPAMAAESESTPPDEEVSKAGGVKSIEERIERLEKAMQRTPASERWYDRLQISGLIEVEASYVTLETEDPEVEDEKQSDVDLATVELTVDEGYLAMNGSKDFSGYLIVGRQYLPFGNFDTHFITDPNTLLLGETNEGALVAGYRIGDETVDFAVGVFNGCAHKAGTDHTMEGLVASIRFEPLETLRFGISYISNLAGSDAFNDAVVDSDNLETLVGGWSVFATLHFLDRFTLMGEYVAALDHFQTGEIYDADDDQKRKPSAWNLELGVSVTDQLEMAVRYGGSDDGGPDFLPESQYGAVLNWALKEKINLAFEYLHAEFEDDVQTTDSLIAQLALEF